MPITFTLDQLAGLRPGHLLIGEPPSGNKVVTEEQFDTEARKSC